MGFCRVKALEELLELLLVVSVLPTTSSFSFASPKLKQLAVSVSARISYFVWDFAVLNFLCGILSC